MGNSPAERIIEFVKSQANLKMYTFESKAGVSGAYFKNQAKGEGRVNSDILANIMKAYPQLNIEWVISGEGDMLKTADYSASEAVPPTVPATVPATDNEAANSKLSKLVNSLEEQIALYKENAQLSKELLAEKDRRIAELSAKQ